jgi:CheY-like chemotaxis protein
MNEQPLRIAIVDDEPLARTVVREFAEKLGVQVIAECPTDSRL